jgi:DNA-binding NarL/FixJ family response regulator
MTGSAILLHEHPLWRDALERLLASAGIRVVATAPDADRLIELVADLMPDVIIVDIEVQDAESALEAIRRTHVLYPEIQTVAFAQTADEETIDAAFRAGARVVCAKSAEPGDIVSAVRQAFRSSIFVARSRSDTGPRSAAADARLTKREAEILRLVAEGNSNAEVARVLWVTEQTIKFHLSNVYRKLDVANRTEASRWAQLNGVLPPASSAQHAPAPAL